MALFTLGHLILIGVYLARRRSAPTTRTAFAVAAWVAAVHLALGIYLAANGVEKPKTDFQSGRSL